MKRRLIATAIIVTLAACSDTGEDGGDMANIVVADQSTATATVDTAYADMSGELKNAAAGSGPLYCDLPMIPGGREAPAMDPQTDSYYSSESPAVVAAFYRHAAEARDKTPKIDALPGNFEIDLTPDDQSGCQVVVGQIQDGTTLVQVTPHDWASADNSKR